MESYNKKMEELFGKMRTERNPFSRIDLVGKGLIEMRLLVESWEGGGVRELAQDLERLTDKLTHSNYEATVWSND